MLMPLEIGLGLRYLRARRRTRIASFITVASLLGIAVGVAALIVILSVMNGFENELRGRLLGMTAHATITGGQRPLGDWRRVLDHASDDPAVAGAAPLVTIEGMIRADSPLFPVLVEGIDPGLESAVSSAEQNMEYGSLTDLTAGSGNIVLGSILALRLGIAPGDSVVILIPELRRGVVVPELKSFTVSGVFEAGLQEHDAGLALVHIADAAAALNLGEAISAVRLRTKDVFAAPAVVRGLTEALGDEFSHSDWTIENASYFRAVMLEKMMMAIILSLVIAVAAFNVVASLVMVVTDKRTDIAILRTLGLSPGGIVRVFLVQGLVIGWFGALLGILFGVVLAINVPTVVPWLEQFFGFQIMPGEIYYVTRIPSDLKSIDVLRIAVAALALTGLATLYPARRAAAVEPAVALRYE